MRIGVSGHQNRDGIDWAWTRDALRDALIDLSAPLEGWSSLAVGADQLFAEIVLELDGHLVTVVPGPWYDDCFDEDGLRRYHALLGRGERILLEGLEGERAFLAAGIEVAERSEALVAIWDGAPAHGPGGTADIVAHALNLGRPVLHLQPIERRSEWLRTGETDVQ